MLAGRPQRTSARQSIASVAENFETLLTRARETRTPVMVASRTIRSTSPELARDSLVVLSAGCGRSQPAQHSRLFQNTPLTSAPLLRSDESRAAGILDRNPGLALRLLLQKSTRFLLHNPTQSRLRAKKPRRMLPKHMCFGRCPSQKYSTAPQT